MKKFNTIFICFILCVIYLSWGFLEDDRLKVNFLNIGQGDAIHIRSPLGQDIVIDGGPDNIFLSELSSEMPWNDREIDYLIISHWHADHMMGFIELFNKYKVNNVLVTAHQPDDYLYEAFIGKIKEKNISLLIVQANQKIIIEDDLYLHVLLADDYHEDYNENSMVVKLNYNNESYLFTGDLGFEGEEKLLSLGYNLSAKYLKVGHHGSKYSSSLEFLYAVSPKICIIQSGKDNKFGHPHPETLDRLKSVGCRILNIQ